MLGGAISSSSHRDSAKLLQSQFWQCYWREMIHWLTVCVCLCQSLVLPTIHRFEQVLVFLLPFNVLLCLVFFFCSTLTVFHFEMSSAFQQSSYFFQIFFYFQRTIQARQMYGLFIAEELVRLLTTIFQINIQFVVVFTPMQGLENHQKCRRGAKLFFILLFVYMNWMKTKTSIQRRYYINYKDGNLLLKASCLNDPLWCMLGDHKLQGHANTP